MSRTLALLSILFFTPAFAQTPVVFGLMKNVSPTFIQEAETGWGAAGSTISTSSFNVKAGDILVAYGGAEHDDNVTLGISGGSLAWTLQQSVNTSSSQWAMAYVWTAVVDTDKSMTVSFTQAGAGPSPKHGGNVLTFRYSSGVGASSKNNVDSAGGSTVNLTTTKANSAIVVFSADWRAQDGSARTWRTGAGALTEQTYSYTSGIYTAYGGYHANAGAIGTYTVGLSAPVSQKFSIIAVEIKGP